MLATAYHRHFASTEAVKIFDDGQVVRKGVIRGHRLGVEFELHIEPDSWKVIATGIRSEPAMEVWRLVADSREPTNCFDNQYGVDGTIAFAQLLLTPEFQSRILKFSVTWLKLYRGVVSLEKQWCFDSDFTASAKEGIALATDLLVEAQGERPQQETVSEALGPAYRQDRTASNISDQKIELAQFEERSRTRKRQREKRQARKKLKNIARGLALFAAGPLGLVIWAMGKRPPH